MSERPIDEPLMISEYQVRPGPGEWVSYGDMIAHLATWAMIPSAGPPAVTVSKRVTVKEPEHGGVDPTAEPVVCGDVSPHSSKITCPLHPTGDNDICPACQVGGHVCGE